MALRALQCKSCQWIAQRNGSCPSIATTARIPFQLPVSHHRTSPSRSPQISSPSLVSGSRWVDHRDPRPFSRGMLQVLCLSIHNPSQSRLQRRQVDFAMEDATLLLLEVEEALCKATQVQVRRASLGLSSLQFPSRQTHPRLLSPRHLRQPHSLCK